MKNNLTAQSRVSTHLIFIVALVVIITCIADSSILRFVGFLDFKVITTHSIELYAIFVTVSILSTLVLLLGIARSRRRENMGDVNSRKKMKRKFKSDFVFISALEIVIIGGLVTILFQMIIIKSYFAFELLLVVYLSFSLAFILIFRLFVRFYNWYLSKRNRLFLLYCVLFVLLMANLLAFLSYFTVGFSKHSPVIKAVPARIFFSLLFSPSPAIERALNLIYEVLTLISFVVAWITTVVLLNEYSKKIGSFRYWILICMPLIYFLSRYNFVISPIIQYLDMLGIQYDVPYLIYLSATQQIGGVLFGIYFWVSSTKILNQKLKDYLVLSALGMMFIFSANEIHGLLIAFFPPFGLVTASFMGLGSYLLYIGIFYLATITARNAEIRTDINRKVEELTLVKNIGRSEIERIVEDQVKQASKSIPKVDSEIREYEFEHEELRQLVQDVMNEVNLKKKRSV